MGIWEWWTMTCIVRGTSGKTRWMMVNDSSSHWQPRLPKWGPSVAGSQDETCVIQKPTDHLGKFPDWKVTIWGIKVIQMFTVSWAYPCPLWYWFLWKWIRNRYEKNIPTDSHQEPIASWSLDTTRSSAFRLYRWRSREAISHAENNLKTKWGTLKKDAWYCSHSCDDHPYRTRVSITITFNHWNISFQPLIYTNSTSWWAPPFSLCEKKTNPRQLVN